VYAPKRASTLQLSNRDVLLCLDTLAATLIILRLGTPSLFVNPEAGSIIRVPERIHVFGVGLTLISPKPIRICGIPIKKTFTRTLACSFGCPDELGLPLV